MSGTTKDRNLGSRTSRARLKKQTEPSWHTLVVGRAALGWQRPGRWLLRTYDGANGGRYSRTFIGRADEFDGGLTFDQAMAAARAALDEPAVASTRLTVREAMANYIQYKQSLGQQVNDVLSRGTAHILPVLGDKVVSELTAQTLRHWLSTMAASPKQTRPKAGQAQFKPAAEGDEQVRARRASANRVLTMLKAALNHAFDEGHVASRDAWGRKLKPFASVDVARIRFLSIAEATRLINACDPDFRQMVRAALETGARYSELARLEVVDFNADAGTIHIRKSKSGKPRHVVLTEQGIEFFKQTCVGRTGSELMFRRPDGAAWDKSNQAEPMIAASARAQIKPAINFHALRHTWASLSTMAGMPLLIVAKNLGHSSTTMVEKHYGHLSPSYISDEIRKAAPRYGVEADTKVTALR